MPFPLSYAHCGRIAKTLHILRLADEPGYRRQILPPARRSAWMETPESKTMATPDAGPHTARRVASPTFRPAPCIRSPGQASEYA